MVPQAAGAENAKMVSDMLTMSLIWTCGILMLPLAVYFCFLGTIISAPESAAGYGYEYATSRCTEMVPELEPELHQSLLLNDTDSIDALLAADECDAQCTITSYARACIAYLLPYAMVETLRFWLGSLEIVSIIAPNASFCEYFTVSQDCWFDSISVPNVPLRLLYSCNTTGMLSSGALTRVPLFWLLMFPFEMGLEGHAYGMAISTAGELLGTYVIVVLWKKPHLEWWQGIDIKGAMNRSLNIRYMKLGASACLQLSAEFGSSAVIFGLLGTATGAPLLTGPFVLFVHLIAISTLRAYRGTCCGVRSSRQAGRCWQSSILCPVYVDVNLRWDMAWRS